MMDIVERVEEAIFAAMNGDKSSGSFSRAAHAALEAAGVRELVEALEAAEHLHKVGILNCPDDEPQRIVDMRRTALARYRGEG